MNTKILNSRRMWCIVLAAVLALTVASLVPAKQAHAVTSYGYKFSLLANGTNHTSAKTKVRAGAASGTVNKDGTDLIMLKSVGVVLRVHSGVTKTFASDSMTLRAPGTRSMGYWKGYGVVKKQYSLWGQVASSGGVGNVGTKVSGKWIP